MAVAQNKLEKVVMLKALLDIDARTNGLFSLFSAINFVEVKCNPNVAKVAN